MRLGSRGRVGAPRRVRVPLYRRISRFRRRALSRAHQTDELLSRLRFPLLANGAAVTMIVPYRSVGARHPVKWDPFVSFCRRLRSPNLSFFFRKKRKDKGSIVER